MIPPRSSRQRYQIFLREYRQRRLDEGEEAGEAGAPTDPSQARRGKRREYLREYARWLWPHRYAVGVLFGLAVVAGGLEMVEPLFMRFIIDHVLLGTQLATSARLEYLHLAGGLFVGVILLSRLIGVLKDYRQRQLNVRVMLSLRRSLFERLLHLPLQKLWEMKTGGILSRLTGDIDTTTGLLQMAIISPAISILRLLIAVSVLCFLNWRLALTALAIIPGVMLLSFAVARRIRPIYRSLRKDVERMGVTRIPLRRGFPI